MLTMTGSSEVGVVGVCPLQLTETGGAEVFITASCRLKPNFGYGSILRNE